jgi:hypothetical protein
LYAGLAWALCVGAAAAQGVRPADRALLARLADVKRAFVEADASRLAAQFPPRTRISVALPGAEPVPSAMVGPGQLRAMLARAMRDARTMRFEIAPRDIDVVDGATPTAYARARWTYELRGSGATRATDLYLSLVRSAEDGEWRIVQMKAIP